MNALDHISAPSMLNVLIVLEDMIVSVYQVSERFLFDFNKVF